MPMRSLGLGVPYYPLILFSYRNHYVYFSPWLLKSPVQSAEFHMSRLFFSILERNFCNCHIDIDETSAMVADMTMLLHDEAVDS